MFVVGVLFGVRVVVSGLNANETPTKDGKFILFFLVVRLGPVPTLVHHLNLGRRPQKSGYK
jgi:hypothetical protein